jgi:AcrR family transcriptional regulator
VSESIPEQAIESRNATEEGILDAARDALADTSYRRLTMDTIAKRAFVSRTAVYFYFPNKRAVVDRLIQRTFTDIYTAAAPYVDGGFHALGAPGAPSGSRGAAAAAGPDAATQPAGMS